MLHALGLLVSGGRSRIKSDLQHDNSQPETGSETFHHHVGRNFCSHIEREEDRERRIVLYGFCSCSGHAQALLEAEEFCIANICSV
jgi:hypothetical protein